MKRIICILLCCCFLGTTACGTKAREEAMALITQVSCEEMGITFSLNGLWEIQKQGELGETLKMQEGQTLDLMARHTESGSNIQMIYEDLGYSQGGTLVRIDDYVNAFREELLNSSDFDYLCSQVTSEHLWGNTYQTFSAEIPELGGKQHFYIRRHENTMLIMLITLYGEDTLEDILALVEEIK